MSEPQAFKPGDVVILKGGGPKLTVSSVEPVNNRMRAFVDWFDDSGKLTSHVFLVEALKKVDE